MINFKIIEGTSWAIDLGGIAVINKYNQKHVFIPYPKAAVWSVLAENRRNQGVIKMLCAILGTESKETLLFLEACMNEWKEYKFIE